MNLDFLYPGPLGTREVDYLTAWESQRQIHAEVKSGERPSTVLLLEHASVYTAGKRTEPQERPLDGTPVVDVDRGGKITWHGPGQLVGYPIVALAEPIDVVEHVRRLERLLMDVCRELGLDTMQVEGRSGVWVRADQPLQGTRPERKVAAIGVRVSRGVTMHGFALNCDCDLSWFDRIVPCGITDAGVTSLAAETGESPGLPEVAHLLRPHLEHYLSFQPYEQSAPLPSQPSQPQPSQVSIPKPAVTYGLDVAVA